MDTLARLALSIGAATLFAACGGSQPPISAPGAMPQNLVRTPLAPATPDHHYESLYSFKGSPDGAKPTQALTAFKGVLFGVTDSGGLPSSYYGFSQGTVFTITRAGNERVLLAFGAPGTSGYQPSNLVALHGEFYGTAYGGYHGAGIIFKVTTDGSESVLYNFRGKPDGDLPDAGLTVLNDKLYGVTFRGGRGGFGKQSDHCRPGYYGCGTLFETRTSVNTERVLYSFREKNDAWFPFSTLVAINGTFYGVTSYGGDRACYSHGCGAVYSILKSGRGEQMLYGFKGSPYDAEYGGNLVVLDNVLYGISGGGGTSGLGTIFSVTLSGAETVIHNFTGGADGASPSGLIALNGSLYGTTQGGGESPMCSGCGTIFKMSTSGEEQVLYSFGGYPTDGSDPSANMTVLDGKLYGTTATGGSANEGTVFRLSP